MEFNDEESAARHSVGMCRRLGYCFGVCRNVALLAAAPPAEDGGAATGAGLPVSDAAAAAAAPPPVPAAAAAALDDGAAAATLTGSPQQLAGSLSAQRLDVLPVAILGVETWAGLAELLGGWGWTVVYDRDTDADADGRRAVVALVRPGHGLVDASWYGRGEVWTERLHNNPVFSAHHGCEGEPLEAPDQRGMLESLAAFIAAYKLTFESSESCGAMLSTRSRRTSRR